MPVWSTRDPAFSASSAESALATNEAARLLPTHGVVWVALLETAILHVNCQVYLNNSKHSMVSMDQESGCKLLALFFDLMRRVG
jgi:hypothetical protein